MIEKRAAPTGAATSAGAEAGKTTGGASIPLDQSTTQEKDRQGLSELLPTGAENALTAKHIAQITGNKPRDVTRAFQRERTAGAAICASGDGFYMAADAVELGRYIRAFDGRLREMQKTRRGLEIAYNRMTGQQILDFPGGDDD